MANFNSSFFTSVFGRDCSEIETDPKADPFDREICESFRRFEDSFNGIFIQPDDERGHPQTTPPPSDAQSLRDSILSRGHEDSGSAHPRPEWSGRKRFNPQLPDQDLDSQLRDNPAALDEILGKNNRRSQNEPHPHYNSSHSSISIRTVRRPDGSIEEYKTVRDSSGREETTVTRTGPDGTVMRDDPSLPYDNNGGRLGRLYSWLWSK